MDESRDRYHYQENLHYRSWNQTATPNLQKPPTQTPIGKPTQPPTAQPRDSPPTPATIPTSVPVTAINEALNAHESEVDWQKNEAFNNHNGCILGTEAAIVENPIINDNIDGREREFNPKQSETDTKINLKQNIKNQHTLTNIGPSSIHQPNNNSQTQTQPTPTSIGLCTNLQPINNTPSQPQNSLTTSGPSTNHQPSNNIQNKQKPMPTKSTWIRIPRDKQSSPTNVLMTEKKHKRNDEFEEGSRPSKKVSVHYEESPEAYSTVVATRQHRRPQ